MKLINLLSFYQIYILPILLFFKYIVPKSSFTSNRYQLSAIAIVTLVFGIISVTLLPSIGKSIALPLIRVALEAIRMIILEKELTETEGIDFVISSTTVRKLFFFFRLLRVTIY